MRQVLGCSVDERALALHDKVLLPQLDMMTMRSAMQQLRLSRRRSAEQKPSRDLSDCRIMKYHGRILKFYHAFLSISFSAMLPPPRFL